MMQGGGLSCLVGDATLVASLGDSTIVDSMVDATIFSVRLGEDVQACTFGECVCCCGASIKFSSTLGCLWLLGMLLLYFSTQVPIVFATVL